MTRKLIVAALAAPFAMLAIAMLVCAAGSSMPVSNEEYAVYSALLESKVASAVPGHDPLSPQIRIRGKTGRFTRSPLLLLFSASKSRIHLASAPWSAELSLAAKSWFEADLAPRLQSPIPYRIVTDEEIEDPNLEFRYVQFGRVGFDTTGETAIVYYDFFCGLCGEGGFAVLIREGDRWIVSQDANRWIS